MSLLQQTPDDTAIGDVLITAPGALRVLEFKREENDDSKEEKRWKRLCKVLKKCPPKMEAVSKEVHWYVETKPNGGNFDDRIVPYLNAFPRPVSFPDGNELATFVELTAENMVNGTPGYTDEEAATYLALLAAMTVLYYASGHPFTRHVTSPRYLSFGKAVGISNTAALLSFIPKYNTATIKPE